MRKVIIGVCFFLLLSATVFQPVTGLQKHFFDMDQSHWAYPAVMEMAEKGILSGYPDSSFRPGALVTYGEFIKMAAVTDGAGFNRSDQRAAEAGQGAQGFYSHWAKPYYDAGLNMFYYSEYDIKPDALDQPIPRALMALIISSMLANAGIEEAATAEYSSVLEKIRDIDSRTPYEFDIVRSYSAGILSGYPDGTFRPNQSLSRAEAALVISRLERTLTTPSGIKTETPNSGESNAAKPGETEKRQITPLVVEGSVGVFPDEPLTLTVPEYGKELIAQRNELKRLLMQYHPIEGEEMYKAALDFASKPLGPGKQGMRKQYFGNWPVLMERLDTTLRIFVLPVGYTNRFWETKPGEINEEFF